jgi:hypothetical protein
MIVGAGVCVEEAEGGAVGAGDLVDVGAGEGEFVGVGVDVCVGVGVGVGVVVGVDVGVGVGLGVGIGVGVGVGVGVGFDWVDQSSSPRASAPVKKRLEPTGVKLDAFRGRLPRSLVPAAVPSLFQSSGVENGAPSSINNVLSEAMSRFAGGPHPTELE